MKDKWIYGISGILFGALIFGLITLFLLQNVSFSDNSILSQVRQDGSLAKILRPIMDNTTIVNGDCLSYALYYKDYLSKTNYTLDVRKIDIAGDCPIGTIQCGIDAGMPHTYLIINGYGGECILDQHLLACNQIRDEK